MPQVDVVSTPDVLDELAEKGAFAKLKEAIVELFGVSPENVMVREGTYARGCEPTEKVRMVRVGVMAGKRWEKDQEDLTRRLRHAAQSVVAEAIGYPCQVKAVLRIVPTTTNKSP